MLLETLEAIHRGGGAPLAAGSERAATDGERRQVTVLACATVVARVDSAPVELEDLDHAMRAQQRLYEQIAEQSGQTLVHGDAGEVQIVFGHPRAHENDARRAVRMALHILDLSQRVNVAVRAERGLLVGVRIGVHSGLGIVRVRRRDSTGETHLEIVGAPTTVAGRLAARAGRDQILATTDTEVLLREEFECEPADALPAGNGDGPIAVVRIVRERPSAALETIVRGEETPLVGRDGELAQIVELWRRAEAGELAVVLLQGEAGIGKSRLVRELRRRVPPARCIACRCVPQGSGTPLHPVVAWLRSLSGSLDRRLDELGFDVTATWPLFADLLEVPLGEGYRPLRHSAERQRELTLAALADLVIRIATRAPLLLVLEDLHWADPTTGELLAKLIEEARAAHVAATASRPGLCLVFTARPEFTALVDG